MSFSYYENSPTKPVVTTPADFAKYFLGGLGVTNPSANQTQEIIDWEHSEGGNFKNTATANELNTTLPLPGSHVLSGGGAAAAAGVQAYGSTAQGLDAQLSTILEPRYANLVADIRGNVPEAQFSTDVGNSPWGTHSWTAGSGGAGASTGTGSFTGTPAGFDIPNPLNLLNGNDAASAIGKVVEAFTAPLKAYLENGFLVVAGVVIVLVALVLAAKGVAGSVGKPSILVNPRAGSGGGAGASSSGVGQAPPDGTTVTQVPNRQGIEGGSPEIEDAEIIA